jgi:hypothetical protein
VFSVTCCSHLDKHIRTVHEKIRAFFCQLCRKSFTEAGNLRKHEKSKQHQPRLMNGCGDDDFFFNNNNNRQRQLIQRIRQRQQQQQQSQNDSNADNAPNRTIGNEIFMFMSKLCIFGIDIDVSARASSSQKATWQHIFVEKTVSMRSMSKALSGARLTGGAQGLAHRGPFGLLSYPCF